MAWGAVRTSSISLTTAANRSLTLPTSIIADELIFITMQQESDTEVTTTCTGYTAGTKGENATPGPDEQYLSFWKFAVGGETTAVFTHASVYCSFACVVIPPPSGTPALDVQGGAVSVNTTATTVTIAAITTLTADTAVLLGVVNYHEDDVTTLTQSFVKQIEVVASLGGGNVIAYKNQAGTGTTGASVVTFGGSVSAVGCQHAFKPGAAAASRVPIRKPSQQLMHLLRR